MKNALLIVSGVSIGLLAACVSIASTDAGLPRAEAQAAGTVSSNGTALMGTGGATPNQNDLCWVLTKVKPANGPERTVLSLYRAERGGEYFNLKDVRMIDADIRVIELEVKKHDPTVEGILRALPKAESDPLRPPPPPGQNANNNNR
jgi:hypothetical protein